MTQAQPLIQTLPMTLGAPMSDDPSNPTAIEIPLQIELPNGQTLFAAVALGGLPFDGQRQIAERMAAAWNAFAGVATQEIQAPVKCLHQIAEPPTQVVDAAPSLGDAWKTLLLDGSPLERDRYGCGYHPALPNFDEGVNGRKFFAVFGIELKASMAENEMESDAYESMTEDGPNYNVWNPERPKGEGWHLVAIFDTEDGPACWWLREVSLTDAKYLDDLAVDDLASLMKEKLAKQREKGYGGWNKKRQCTQQHLSNLLREHVGKGDPVDVANFCAMLSARGETIAAAPQAVQVAVPSDAEIDAAIQAFDWEGWTDPEKAKRAFTREALSRWTAAAHPAEGVPAPVAAQASPTFMTADQGRDWAWNKLREDVSTEGWTVMDSVNYHGFFLHGWNCRGQYELQRAAAVAALKQELTVVHVAVGEQSGKGVLTMAKNSKPVDAQGWCRPNPDGPEHYFTDAYPACGWKLPVKTNESGRCIECERAAQAAKQGEPQANPARPPRSNP